MKNRSVWTQGFRGSLIFLKAYWDQCGIRQETVSQVLQNPYSSSLR